LGVFCIGFIWFLVETRDAEEIKEDEEDGKE
jgi:hypothetical protein